MFRPSAATAARSRAVASFLILSLLCACAGLPPEDGALELGLAPIDASPATVASQLDAVEAELAADAPWAATRRAIRVREVRDLGGAEANRVDRLLEQSVTLAAERARKSSDFDGIEPEKLPRRARAICTLGEARALLDEGEYFEAFLKIRDLERVHRTHHLRDRAGDLIYESALRLAEDRRRLLWIFRRSTNAPQVLEYLVIQHPMHPRTPEAYLRLAGGYESSGQLQLAIERYEEFLLYHPDAPGSVEAEARVPQLRLDLQLRDDYDRAELLRAREGLERWLDRHADRPEVPEELVATVRDDLADALGRLTRSDLSIARFYARVGEPVGCGLHAQRALGLARQGGFPDLEREALALLEEGAAYEAPRLEGTAIPAFPPVAPESSEVGG